jgi:hypothetical protein
LLTDVSSQPNGGKGRPAVFEQRMVNGGSRHARALNSLMFSLRQRPLMADAGYSPASPKRSIQ